MLRAMRAARLASSSLFALILFVGAACGEDPTDESSGSDSGLPERNDLDGSSTADATSDLDGGADADTGPLSASYTDFAVNHVLITGQSNSVSNSGTPVLSTTQPFTNLMFDTGVMPMSGCDGNGCTTYQAPTSLVPLVEGDKFFDYAVETAAAGLANEVSHLATTKLGFGENPAYPKKHDVLLSIHGRSGNTYWCLRKGGCNYKPSYLDPFAQGMMEVESGKALSAAAGKTYVVRAVATIHGESDHYSNLSEFPLKASPCGGDNCSAVGDGTVKDYADALVEWQKDYEASIQAITKQKEPVPLFVIQISGWNDQATSKVAQQELDAHVKAPGKVLLVGPSYPIPLDQQDCLHFTNNGARQLGEYFAKAYARVVFEGKPWEPVRPTQVTRNGAVITVKYAVLRPPLVFDTTKVAAAANMGFTFSDDSGAPPAIAANGVSITAPDTIQITLASTPTGGQKRLRYAQNQQPGTCIGTPLGARGNVRDSDDTPSKNGYDLHDWGVAFDVSVP
jgi:hypothetical protein